MKRRQTGEVMLVVMIVMMTIVLLSRGHMGMMGYGPASAEKPPETAQPEEYSQPLGPAPDESTVPQRK